MAPVNILTLLIWGNQLFVTLIDATLGWELFITYVDLRTVLPSLLNFVRIIMYFIANDLMCYSICYNCKLRRIPLVCLFVAPVWSALVSSVDSLCFSVTRFKYVG